MFLSSGEGYVGELLELHQGCQGPFEAQERRWDFSRDATLKRASSRIEGKSPGFSRITAGNLGFFLSYIWYLRDPLVLPQESQVPMRIVRGLSGFLSRRCRGLGPNLELSPEPQFSSSVLTWISEFPWSFNRGVRPHLVWRHGSPLST